MTKSRRHLRYPLQEYTDSTWATEQSPSMQVACSIIDVDLYLGSITLPEGKFDLEQVLSVMRQIDRVYDGYRRDEEYDEYRRDDQSHRTSERRFLSRLF